VFPALSWKTKEPVAGLFVLDPGNGALRKAGVTTNEVVTEVRGRKIDLEHLRSLEGRVGDLSSADVKSTKP